MIKRIGLLMVAAILAATMMVATAPLAFAAPQCPGGGTAVKGEEPGTFVCPEAEEQKNPKKTEIQEETFKGAPPADKSQGEEETQCVMETGGGTKVKEGPCPGGQEPN